jgi:hypothetical protein
MAFAIAAVSIGPPTLRLRRAWRQLRQGWQALMRARLIRHPKRRIALGFAHRRSRFGAGKLIGYVVQLAAQPAAEQRLFLAGLHDAPAQR